MFRNDRIFHRSFRVAFLIVALTFAVNGLQAQTPVPAVTPTPTDPGPRPQGKEPLNNDPNAVCPIPGAKFPETVCVDFAQPTPVAPAPAADGAGQVLANGGNLTGAHGLRLLPFFQRWLA
jgi:hypothetical protein